jgi:hypothetical protein
MAHDEFLSYRSSLSLIYSNEALSAPVRGALIASLNKRMKREWIVSVVDSKLSPFDLTPTAALQIIRRITGRGVSTKYLLDALAVKSRTAANKSEIFTKNLSTIERDIRREFVAYQQSMYGAFLEIKIQYRPEKNTQSKPERA